MAWRAVTDTHWKLIEAQLPKRKADKPGGRPPLSDRQCFEGILWILRQAPRGANCQRGMAPRVPSTAASQHGRQVASS
jgi:transposase